MGQYRLFLIVPALLLMTMAVAAAQPCLNCFALKSDSGFAPVKNPSLSPALDTGVLLIAGDNLVDPNFEKTVVLITAYDHNGTAGVIINRPSDIPVPVANPWIADLLSQPSFLYLGGPVAINGVSLLLRSPDPVSGIKAIVDDIYHINSQAQIQQLQSGRINAKNARLYAGVSGWAPGQLESELLRGDWHIWHASADTVFSETPDRMWFDLISLVSAKWVYRSTPAGTSGDDTVIKPGLMAVPGAKEYKISWK